jgi:hypothetical protein
MDIERVGRMRNFLYATAVMLSVSCAGNSQAAPSDRAALSGSWVLNERDSQNPLALIGSGPGGFGTGGRGTPDGTIIPDGRGTGTAPGTRTAGRSGGRGAAQLATNRAKAQVVQQKLEVFADMHKRITINDNGATVNVAYAIGPQMSYRVGGKQPADTVPVLGVVRKSAEWKDGVFILHHKIGDLDMKEEFTRNIGSKRLVVYTTVKGLARMIQYRRVYDPA